MPLQLSLLEFLSKPGVILDVRSPSEYIQGHIPKSTSLPLFSDEQRAQIGTIYKQNGKQQAIDLGLKIVGPQLYNLVQAAKQALNDSEAKLLCWRGGMRSGFVANLLDSIGIKTYVLSGGYKSFRRWILKTLSTISDQSSCLFTLGGLTGSGKTSMLQKLKEAGEQTIDLENLANHRGSSFGNIGLGKQTSQEQFENQLALQWNQLDLSRPIWIEDESRLIGKCCIPPRLYNAISKAPLFYMDIPKEQRLLNLLHIYGQASQKELIEATVRLNKRLGSQLSNEICTLLNHDQKKEAFSLLLSYYDKTYLHHLKQKKQVHNIITRSSLTPCEWVKNLKQASTLWQKKI